MLDWKQYILWSIRYWYVYVISLCLCTGLGCLYYFSRTPKYEVGASVMLRTPSNRTAQDQLIGLMGIATATNSGDEIEMLSSSSLMEQVIEQLQLQTLYFVREDLHWNNLYPERPFTLVFPENLPSNVVVTIRARQGRYIVHVKDSKDEESKFVVSNLHEPIETHIGTLRVHCAGELQEGRYRVKYMLPNWAVAWLQKSIDVSRSSRESNIIHLKSTTDKPQLMRAVFETMLQLYAGNSVSDKSMVAAATEHFLQQRIDQVGGSLDSTEIAIETYKRDYGIANLQTTTETYRSLIDHYEQRIAFLDANLEIMDYVSKTLNDPNASYAVLPRDFGVTDGTLSQLVAAYNAQVIERDRLLQSATESNPSVEILTEQIRNTRKNLIHAVEQSRQTAVLTRKNEERQRDLYANRLQNMPEVEKHYQELLRLKSAQEKQYNYLVEKHEENQLLLASDAIPARVIEKPIVYPEMVSPKIPNVILLVVLLGLLLPFGCYLLVQGYKEIKGTAQSPQTESVA